MRTPHQVQHPLQREPAAGEVGEAEHGVLLELESAVFTSSGRGREPLTYVGVPLSLLRSSHTLLLGAGDSCRSTVMEGRRGTLALALISSLSATAACAPTMAGGNPPTPAPRCLKHPPCNYPVAATEPHPREQARASWSAPRPHDSQRGRLEATTLGSPCAISSTPPWPACGSLFSAPALAL